MTTLDYGRLPTARRRAVKWAIVVSLFVVAFASARFAAARLERSFTRRSAEEQFAAWFKAARAETARWDSEHATSPPDNGPGVYDERRIWSHYSGSATNDDGTSRRFLEVEGVESLQNVRRDAAGLPTPYFDGIHYAHEHAVPIVGSGVTVRVWTTVGYRGLDASSRAKFQVSVYRISRDGTTIELPPTTVTIVAAGIARPLRTLRIGFRPPAPGDAARFSLPFACDAGRGRFEFRFRPTSPDDAIGPPDARVEWDAAIPGAADAVQR